MTGHLDLGVTHNIINVADPSLAQDASTKHYTDAADSLRLKLDGTTAMTGSLNMGTTNKIINVADPTNSTDCATKQYVDSLAVDPNTYLPRDGTMPMTGMLMLGMHKIINVANPSIAQDASTKYYTDTADNLRLKLDGTTAMTGSLNMGNTNKVINLTDPTNLQDACTKYYTDAADNLRLKLDGTTTMIGNLNMGNTNKIINLADPVNSTDGVTKQYVDSVIPNLNTYLLRDGSMSMTGSLNMGTTNKITNVANPTVAQDVSTKNYTDTADNLRLKLDGTIAMTGSLNMGTTNKIINLADPTNLQDACTKKYTDIAVKKILYEVTNPGTQSISLNTFTRVTAPSVIEDTTNSFASNRFTAPTTGWYFIYAFVQFQSTNTNYFGNTHIYKNGTAYRQIGGGSGSGNNGSFGEVTGSLLMKLNSTDYIELYAFSNTNISIQLITFSGHIL